MLDVDHLVSCRRCVMDYAAVESSPAQPLQPADLSWSGPSLVGIAPVAAVAVVVVVVAVAVLNLSLFSSFPVSWDLFRRCKQTDRNVSIERHGRDNDGCLHGTEPTGHVQHRKNKNTNIKYSARWQQASKLSNPTATLRTVNIDSGR